MVGCIIGATGGLAGLAVAGGATSEAALAATTAGIASGATTAGCGLAGGTAVGLAAEGTAIASAAAAGTAAAATEAGIGVAGAAYSTWLGGMLAPAAAAGPAGWIAAGTVIVGASSVDEGSQRYWICDKCGQPFCERSDAERHEACCNRQAHAQGHGKEFQDRLGAKPSQVPQMAHEDTIARLRKEGLISADCWKDVLHETSANPSDGMALHDLLTDDHVRSYKLTDTGIVLETKDGNRFLLYPVELPHDTYMKASEHIVALHATKIQSIEAPVEAPTC